MVDHAHFFDVRAYNVRAHNVRIFAPHAFDTLDVGTLSPDSQRRPNPSPACGRDGKSPVLDFSGLQVAALFVLFAFIAAIPVLLHPLPPISDFNHPRACIIAVGRIRPRPFHQVGGRSFPTMMDMICPCWCGS
jgi:hypothetical protein